MPRATPRDSSSSVPYVNPNLGWLPWVGANDSPYLTVYAATFWWVAVTAIATWVLLRTRAGNWIFAVGGAQTSARQVGVPVARTKIGLFITTAVAGWLVGMLELFKTTTAQSTTGVGEEFIYIICAVVGGCLLTGGYGSAIGAALGALIFGMVSRASSTRDGTTTGCSHSSASCCWVRCWSTTGYGPKRRR